MQRVFNKKTKYFRLRLSNEVGTERPENDLRLTWDWPETDLRQTQTALRWKLRALEHFGPERQTNERTNERTYISIYWAPVGAKNTDLMSLHHQSIDKMRAHKPCSPSHQDSLLVLVGPELYLGEGFPLSQFVLKHLQLGFQGTNDFVGLVKLSCATILCFMDWCRHCYLDLNASE